MKKILLICFLFLGFIGCFDDYPLERQGSNFRVITLTSNSAFLLFNGPTHKKRRVLSILLIDTDTNSFSFISLKNFTALNGGYKEVVLGFIGEPNRCIRYEGDVIDSLNDPRIISSYHPQDTLCNDGCTYLFTIDSTDFNQATAEACLQ